MSRTASEEVIAGRAAISVNDPGTDVPEGWARVRLTDIARLESGHTPSRKHPEWWGGDVPWVSLPDAREHHGGVILDTTQKTNELGLANSAARLLPKDTVCLSRTASVGYVVRLGRAMATSQDFVNWVCSEVIEPRFLQQALLAEGKHLLNFGMGTTHTTIYFPAVLAFHINLAPRAEQRRIVEKVEALLEQVNRVKERLERVPLILKRFRQAVLAAACSDGDEVEIGDLVESVRYGTAMKCSAAAKGTPVLRIPNVVSGTIDHKDMKYGPLSAKEAASLNLVPGDILLIRSNGSVGLVGKCALVTEREGRCSFAGYLMRLRPRRDGVVAEYLHLALQTYDVRAQIEVPARSTSGVHNINAEEVKNLRIRLPSLADQRAAVREVRGLFACADSIERHVQAVSARVEGLPQTILCRAFSGELVPTEAELARAEERSFESASEMLSRVRPNLQRNGDNESNHPKAPPRRASRTRNGKGVGT